MKLIYPQISAKQYTKYPVSYFTSLGYKSKKQALKYTEDKLFDSENILYWYLIYIYHTKLRLVKGGTLLQTNFLKISLGQCSSLSDLPEDILYKICRLLDKN